jgi:hypothetical protein
VAAAVLLISLASVRIARLRTTQPPPLAAATHRQVPRGRHAAAPAVPATVAGLDSSPRPG